MTQQLPMWVIYDHPNDDPEHYVARLWKGGTPTGETLVAEEVDDLREQFQRMGLHRLERFEEDEPQIMEVWL